VTSGLALAFDDSQQAIADALAQFCADRCDEAVLKEQENRFPRGLWSELAELGVLALVTPEGDGGAVELVAALESLGRGLFPGPLPATFFATQVLPETERRAVASGEAVVSVGVPPLMPWAPAADLFVSVQNGSAALMTARGEIAAVETLGGEPWGRVDLEQARDLGSAERAHLLYQIAVAAYAAGAGTRLVEATAEHARTRKQFGRAIGEFQSVSHPLADRHMELAAAATLARAAAFHFDAEHAGAARRYAAAARIAACRAGVEAAHTCHQLFGAQGITLEGPVFHVARRLRQLASQPPGDARARSALLAGLGIEERA
jgi:alkylation response protein AidB-like acyl-CoA dehydrogenase